MIHVSLCVDNLDARNDANKSDRISSYDCTEEEVQQILIIIKNIKKRKNIRTDIVGCISPEQIKASEEAWDRNHPYGK
jgi:thymidylate synthase